MTTLNDFTADAQARDSENPPRMQRDRRLRGGHTRDGGDRQLGWVGLSPERGCRCFATVRDSETHRIHAVGGDSGAYAISDDGLEKLAMFGCGRVFVVEDDTGDVLEWRFDTFAAGDPVPDYILQTENDPQTYMPASTARHRWSDWEPEFWLPAEWAKNQGIIGILDGGDDDD